MSPTSPRRVDSAMGELFRADADTPRSRLLLRICGISGTIVFSWPLFDLVSRHVSDSIGNILVAVLTIVGLTFITSLCLLGIRSAGRSAGKRTFLSQLMYTLSRVFLYVLLPCIILTALLVIWGMVTHQPAFR